VMLLYRGIRGVTAGDWRTGLTLLRGTGASKRRLERRDPSGVEGGAVQTQYLGSRRLLRRSAAAFALC